MEAYTIYPQPRSTDLQTDLSAKSSWIQFEACPRVPDLFRSNYSPQIFVNGVKNSKNAAQTHPLPDPFSTIVRKQFVLVLFWTKMDQTSHLSVSDLIFKGKCLGHF